jgi:hypothetical protein
MRRSARSGDAVDDCPEEADAEQLQGLSSFVDVAKLAVITQYREHGTIDVLADG